MSELQTKIHFLGVLQDPFQYIDIKRNLLVVADGTALQFDNILNFLAGFRLFDKVFPLCGEVA